MNETLFIYNSVEKNILIRNRRNYTFFMFSSYWFFWFSRNILLYYTSTRHATIYTVMSSNTYSLSFCVKCRQKTKWLNPVTLTKRKNKTPFLHGTCYRCKCTKSTFVTLCYYVKELQKQRYDKNAYTWFIKLNLLN